MKAKGIVARWKVRLKFYQRSEKLWKSRHTYRNRKVKLWSKREYTLAADWRNLRDSRPKDDKQRIEAWRAYQTASGYVKKWEGLREEASKNLKNRREQVAKAKRVIERHSHSQDDQEWGGSRAVTNEIIAIVNGRYPVTSRKRSETYGNPGSDHHISQKYADAVDFGTVENHALKNEISRKLGGPSTLADYASFQIQRNGRAYRVQAIASNHGTGPHLHLGVKRV
jgi:hypothetical protein